MNGWMAAALLGLHIAQASPQSWVDKIDLGGEVNLLVDVLPKQDAAELRPELLVDVVADLSARVRIQGNVAVSGLAARRDAESRTDLIVRTRDTWIEIAGRRADLRAGYGQVVWGRLDEIQPTDVINPVDAARFLLEGRAQARLPVAFARGRVFLSDALVLEGVVVPWFRRGRFDELDEETSPFNLIRGQLRPGEAQAAIGGALQHAMPANGWESFSGGGRLSATIGRVDVSTVAYRGIDAFGPVVFEAAGVGDASLTIPGRFVERHERFTMIGGAFETVAGDWGWRGEVAAFVRKQLAGLSRPGLVDGRIVEAGLGFDRLAGQFRVYGSVIGRREWSNEDPALDRSDVSVVGSAERWFDRRRYLIRAFGLANPTDESGFLRGLLSWHLQDNVVLDLSAGAFFGTGDDTVSRFKDRDFISARFSYYF